MQVTTSVSRAIADLWREGSVEKLNALELLYHMVVDMVDIRAAQPAITLLLVDDDAEVRRAALALTSLRADMGADIGLAVPTLAMLLDDEDEETRTLAEQSLRFADMRLPGIAEAVTSCFAGGKRFSEPAEDEDCGDRRGFRIGAWGRAPWESAPAVEWFGRLFDGMDVEPHLDGLFEKTCDRYGEVRAAAYFLQCFGRPHIWPGNRDRLGRHLNRAIAKLADMIDVAQQSGKEGFLALWDGDEEVIASVEAQIDSLKQLVD